jgi:hypothetical protein
MKMAVIVPYRDRESHLKLFVPFMTKFLTHHGYDFEIYMIEQDDDLLFNRGALINVGVKMVEADYYVSHDVDLLPAVDVYQYPEGNPYSLVDALQRGGFRTQRELKRRYVCYGGVNAFTKEQFEKIGGFPWGYFGWGQEDDVFRNRTKGAGYKILRRPGLHVELPHKPNRGGKRNRKKGVTDNWEIIGYEEKTGYKVIKVCFSQ